ncbi:MAG: hypothetical protein EOO01_16115 [Chitinophagaceae bacterium]|nr:MAG: hypothetical protein EOO01_16115 [Chitinophagaceae bacterium]
MSIQHLKARGAALVISIVLFISCTNQTQDTAKVDNGVTDTTNIFAPDTMPSTDTSAMAPATQQADSGFRP